MVVPTMVSTGVSPVALAECKQRPPTTQPSGHRQV